jgi:hypothetical protein
MVLAESPNSTSGATNSALNERARILTNTNALRPGIAIRNGKRRCLLRPT